MCPWPKDESRNQVPQDEVDEMKKKDQCPRAKINEQYCTCTYSCDKHGICCECLHYHRQRGEIPACFFTVEEEKTYNRTVQFFIQRRS